MSSLHANDDLSLISKHWFAYARLTAQLPLPFCCPLAIGYLTCDWVIGGADMAYGSVISDLMDTREIRKSRGAFFTPDALADLVTTFAITSKDDYVFEPSCGEAAFLLSAARRLKTLGASINEINTHLCGNELHRESVIAARQRLKGHGYSPAVTSGDFFDMSPKGDGFDAVIGNPPYIRYQDFSGDVRRKALEDALECGVKIDALTSSWAPFVVHATRFLRYGGKLGFVLPAELMVANYAAPVRDYLLRSFNKVNLVLFDSPVFPEVQEEVVLLLAEGFGIPNKAGSHVIISQVSTKARSFKSKSFVMDVNAGDRWLAGHAMRDAAELLTAIPGGFTQLSEYGKIHLGAVTGSNGFFSMTRQRADELALTDQDLVPICPPGSRHLRTLSLSTDDLSALDEAGKPTLLFSPKGEPSDAGKRYIEYGQETGISNAYKCRVRKPWWRVPGLKQCDIFITYMNGFGPNLCANEARVCFLNSVHGLFLDASIPEVAVKLLPVGALSSVTLLSAELFGRSYGGGVLKLEPAEAGLIYVPAPKLLIEADSVISRIRNDVACLLSEGKREAATQLVDEILLPRFGFSENEISHLESVLREVRNRRMVRGKSQKLFRE